MATCCASVTESENFLRHSLQMATTVLGPCAACAAATAVVALVNAAQAEAVRDVLNPIHVSARVARWYAADLLFQQLCVQSAGATGLSLVRT